MESKERIMKRLEEDGTLNQIIEQAWNETDVDHNGNISKAELLNCMNFISKKMNLTSPNDEQFNTLFASLDLDKSGYLNKDEFSIFVRKSIESLLDDIIEAHSKK
jgi:Ca2+-binding EF-hand superfamily protein